MSRFEYFIDEEVDHDKINWDEEGYYQDIANQIKRDCKPWLTESKGRPGFRATNNVLTTYGLIRKKVRTNRRALSTRKGLHKMSDKLFNDIWGWKARSNVLFLMGDSDVPSVYGRNIWAVFPIGEFTYLWSQELADFLQATDRVHRQIYNILQNIEYFEHKVKINKAYDEDSYKGEN